MGCFFVKFASQINGSDNLMAAILALKYLKCFRGQIMTKNAFFLRPFSSLNETDQSVSQEKLEEIQKNLRLEVRKNLEIFSHEHS